MLIFNFINGNTSVRTYISTICTTNTFVRIFYPGKIISFTVHFICQYEHIARAGDYTQIASFASFGIDK